VAVSLDRQLVIFSADSARPSLADLTGLLIGSGQVSRMGGTARVSVAVSQAWRVHALAAEFAARGLSISWEPSDDGTYWVRTSYASTLVRLAPPSFLDGPRLRLWYLASGELEEGDEHAVLLGLGHNQALARPALAPLGLDGEVVKGPAIRIVGEAKRRRLADLIGECPARAPREAWPIASRPARPAATSSPRAVARPRRTGDNATPELWPLDPPIPAPRQAPEPAPREALTEPMPSEALTEPMPSEALAQAMPSEALAQAMPSEALTQAVPSEALTEPTLREAPTDRIPSEPSAEPAPGEASVEVVHGEAAADFTPAEAVRQEAPAGGAPRATALHEEPVETVVRETPVAGDSKALPLARAEKGAPRRAKRPAGMPGEAFAEEAGAVGQASVSDLAAKRRARAASAAAPANAATPGNAVAL
jgi:hypothetical protein